jgi:hypothetical protein
VYGRLWLAPWEAALGASLPVRTPKDGCRKRSKMESLEDADVPGDAALSIEEAAPACGVRKQLGVMTAPEAALGRTQLTRACLLLRAYDFAAREPTGQRPGTQAANMVDPGRA